MGCQRRLRNVMFSIAACSHHHHTLSLAGSLPSGKYRYKGHLSSVEQPTPTNVSVSASKVGMTLTNRVNSEANPSCIVRLTMVSTSLPASQHSV